jgi:hypothetical protein
MKNHDTNFWSCRGDEISAATNAQQQSGLIIYFTSIFMGFPYRSFLFSIKGALG